MRHNLLLAGVLAAFAADAVTASPLQADESKPTEAKGKPKQKDGPKPYDEVIPESAVTDAGLLLVHRVDDSLLYEIPADQLDVDMLWVTQIAATQSGFGYGGTPSGRRVVRWELRGDDVLLRDVQYDIRADTDDTVKYAVRATSVAPILDVFAIKAWGKDKAPVIDVTDFFKGDPDEFSSKRRLQASGVDKKRTFVESVKAFPTNVEIKVLKTYKLKEPKEGVSGVTVVQHHSMIRLPDEPMQPREHDERVGFFSVSYEDYASDEHAVEQVRYITRWRLEKKDPGAELSEPKQPIVFYVGRGVPERWRPWVRAGIEYWQSAFEDAGFARAIIAKDAPSAREDPDWDAEDARYSTIRWLPSTVENAMGPHVNDPRTGEILEADILVYHNVIKLCRDWYFVQASPCDERAQDLPMPDELLGELLAYVIAHEVGHSLGFPHNMKASSSYTVEQLRDAAFTAEHGTEASIMDYGRFNYVAQPGDGARLIPKIGPYDRFAVDWGYRQYADSAAEEQGLAALVAMQKSDATLRFGNPNPSEDPSQQTEDLGSDPVAATALGLANLDRVAGFLIAASCEEGEDYSLLRNMFDQLHGQRDRELGHVANVVGGFYKNNLFFGDADAVWEPVSAERQRAAVAFLNENAFQTPAALVDPAICLRLETNGVADRLLSGQKRLLRTLVSERRVKRMAEQVEREGDGAYTPVDMLRDLSRGIWSELEATDGTLSVDLYRRNLQRAHVEQLGGLVEQKAPASDLPALARGELEWIFELVTDVTPLASDETTRRHLVDLRERVGQRLDPRGGIDPEARAA